ncbi:Leukocyte immunoglobulin-like receptor subfamily B member 4 [Channa argus]|uniref:Leukocyte immunoglobulin-like receptor subfamily B member 4 n=1 Tax=Channa argus TaxID=215402 RepID=A0A6G1QAN4_CHAAH|nr:Leukocyte immunoglobulin-like receptor subfamily B member 4 [Channa argus]
MMSRQQRNLQFLIIVSFLLALSSPAAGSVQKPRISISPAGEVTWGQDVSITCSISTQILNGTFILQKTSSSFRETQTSNTNSATFNIRKMDFDKEGLYQCQYQKMGSNQTFSSPLSDSVRLSITVSLQQPIISLTSSNRGVVLGPEGAEVTRGYNFGITCFIYSIYPEGRFFLIFSGANIIDSKSAVNYAASFNFPAAEYEHQGNYSCVYEVTLSTRRFNSTGTAPINIIIKLPLLPLVSSVTAGSLLLLLLPVLVAFFTYRRRRRRQVDQPATLIFSQLPAKADNDYDCEEDADYVNADQLERKEIEEEVATVEKEESDDDEESESNSDHDYEEECPAENNVKPKEISLSVEDCSDHDEEDNEGDDDEDDYVNVYE